MSLMPHAMIGLLLLLSGQFIFETVGNDSPYKIAKSCETKIEALVTSNEKATLSKGNRGKASFPDDYDFEEQKRVLDAIWNLNDSANECWNQIVTHLEDKRHSITCQGPTGSWFNQSVGAICRRIVYRNIEFFESKLRMTGPVHRPEYLSNEPAKLKEWCEKHSDQSLYERQLDAVEWAIETERKRGFESRQEENAVLAPLMDYRATLREKKAPIKVRPWGSDELSFKSAPPSRD